MKCENIFFLGFSCSLCAFPDNARPNTQHSNARPMTPPNSGDEPPPMKEERRGGREEPPPKEEEEEEEEGGGASHRHTERWREFSVVPFIQ